jgi:hypothetical protein
VARVDAVIINLGNAEERRIDPYTICDIALCPMS